MEWVEFYKGIASRLQTLGDGLSSGESSDIPLRKDVFNFIEVLRERDTQGYHALVQYASTYAATSLQERPQVLSKVSDTILANASGL